jgi:hypothetical protein
MPFFSLAGPGFFASSVVVVNQETTASTGGGTTELLAIGTVLMRVGRDRVLVWIVALIGVCAAVLARGEDEPSAQAVRFFESEVRPLLAAKCQKCHGPRQQRGGLRLDSRSAALMGGKTGPALVPGNLAESLLIEAVNYESLEMPPDGPLSSRETTLLADWVKMGAPWRESPGAASRKMGGTVTDEDRAYWAFQPLGNPPVPVVDDGGWSRNPIDLFVIEKLKAEHLDPAPDAGRRALVRRAFYDLTGLPPAPAEVDRLVKDTSPGAYEAMIDRLLASPRYGERWGRHWLDLARYAESDGHGGDRYRPEAWRYRDHVIHAFNDDKPYDRFILEQLAGDEVAPDDFEALTATGFLRHWIYENNQREVREVRAIILNDVTDVTADVFLGLGFGCARCHDHKFDPILQEDYYRLQAFFAPMLPRDDIITASALDRERFRTEQARWEEATVAARSKLDRLEEPVRQALMDREIRLLPQELKDIYRKRRQEQSPFERQLTALIDRLKEGSGRSLDGQFKLMPEKADAWKAALEELAGFDALRPEPLPAPMVVTDVGPKAPSTVMPGSDQVLEPGFPVVLGGEVPRIEPPPTAPGSTGRRSVLAHWIASPTNPLTARVIVNRVWQYHFGTGLVATSSDFGRLGEQPSHPELLDWLATRFIQDGWRFKSLHRLIMTSATYRQSALESGSAAARRNDPAGRWLWRMGIRRLDADQIRDTLLSASGELDLRPGGPGVDASMPRRTVYTKVMRYTPEPLLQAFDAPDAFVSIPQRDTTTTATQALSLLNGPWSLGRAEAVAARVLGEAGGLREQPALVERAYRLVLGRSPDAFEIAAAQRFLSEQPARIAARGRPPAGRTTSEQALIDFCHVLLNSNELIYLD